MSSKYSFIMMIIIINQSFCGLLFSLFFWGGGGGGGGHQQKLTFTQTVDLPVFSLVTCPEVNLGG